MIGLTIGYAFRDKFTKYVPKSHYVAQPSRAGNSLIGNKAADAFQDDAPKGVFTAHTTANAQDFQAGQMSRRIKIGGDTIRQILGSNGRFGENDAESVG